MSGEYTTKSLDAMTVLSEAATALREVTRSLFAPLSRQLPVGKDGQGWVVLKSGSIVRSVSSQ